MALTNILAKCVCGGGGYLFIYLKLGISRILSLYRRHFSFDYRWWYWSTGLKGDSFFIVHKVKCCLVLRLAFSLSALTDSIHYEVKYNKCFCIFNNHLAVWDVAKACGIITCKQHCAFSTTLLPWWYGF